MTTKPSTKAREFKITDTVKVKLTKHGKEILKKYVTAEFRHTTPHQFEEHLKSITDDDGWTEFKFDELIEVFAKTDKPIGMASLWGCFIKEKIRLV